MWFFQVRIRIKFVLYFVLRLFFFWKRLSMMWWIMQIDWGEDNILPDQHIILHIILVVDLIQNFGLFLGSVSGYNQFFFLLDTPQKVDNTHRAIFFLQVFAFLPLTLVRNWAILSSDSSERHSLSSLLPKRPRFQANITSHNLDVKQTSIESLDYRSHLVNMVSASWLWRLISRGIGANQERRSTMNE